MVYTNSIATMKWWDPHTKKVKYFSSTKFDKNKNKLGKGWSPGFELITGTNNSTLPKLKVGFSDHPFIKYDIFKVTVNFPPRGTSIGIIVKYCEYHNMSCTHKSTNYSHRNHDFPKRKRTDV